jgi:hypothetical protein
MVSGEGGIFDFELLLDIARKKTHFLPVDDVRYRVTRRRGPDPTSLNE